MEQLVLFDDSAIRGNLLPFTFTRPVSDIRVGILTIREKWEKHLGMSTGHLTQDYLKVKFTFRNVPSLFINGALCPDLDLLSTIAKLDPNQALWAGKTLLAARVDIPANYSPEEVKTRLSVEHKGEVNLIQKPWHIFQNNAAELRKDFELLTAHRFSMGINDSHTKVYNEEMIFVEEGAVIRAAVLNAENGPIYIGKNSEIQEGSLIRGPFALCEGSTVNMGAKMRGDTTVGPYSKVGGEISNSVLFGYSNKPHDGFLGNSVIGEWCNLGADTNTSNLKNNYAPIRLWDYIKGGYADTGLQFCGLMMGDHSKCGINTMLNTGTVVGVGANIYGPGFPRNFISSFSWGGASGFTTHKLQKFEETAAVVMKRRGLVFDEVDKNILQKVFELTEVYRIWEKGI